MASAYEIGMDSNTRILITSQFTNTSKYDDINKAK